jgi:hypothetical protein
MWGFFWDGNDPKKIYVGNVDNKQPQPKRNEERNLPPTADVPSLVGGRRRKKCQS